MTYINNNLRIIINSLKITNTISRFNLFWKIKIILFIFSLYLIAEGIFGTQIGILNPAITLIWIGWWMMIVLVYLPFNAKNWCSICPIPLVGQVYNRYAPLKWLHAKKFNKRISIFGFLPLLLFLVFSALSVPISTLPMVTGIILLLLILISFLFDSYYGERTFCKELCPINPLLQTYNTGKSVTLKTVDFSICTSDHEKTCMIGDDNSFGCDWGYFPGKLKVNENNCTNCCDCVKSCSYNNLTLTTKKPKLIPGDHEKINLIRSFSPLFFLGIAILYSFTKIATIKPFHELILINNVTDIILVLLFESFFTLIGIPLVFALVVLLPFYIIVKDEKLKNNLIKKSTFVSIPLSLAIWILFTLFLIIPNINLLFLWVSDPFSFHWNLLNLKDVSLFNGSIKELFNYIGQIILIIGYYFSLVYSYKLINVVNIEVNRKFLLVMSQFVFYSLIFLSISAIYL